MATAPIASSYLGWDIEYVNPPIPHRGFDWCAVEPNSDGEIAVYSGTYTGVLGEVDAYYAEISDLSLSHPVARGGVA